MLLNNAVDDAALFVNDGAPPLQGSGLEMLARQYMEVQAIIKRWSRRYDARLLEQLIYMPALTAETSTTSDAAARLGAATLERALNAPNDANGRVPDQTCRPASQAVDGEGGRAARCSCAATEHGSFTEKALPREFFASAEYRRIAELGTDARAA